MPFSTLLLALLPLQVGGGWSSSSASGAAVAGTPHRNPGPGAQTSLGPIRGSRKSVRGIDINQFFGVPFATPPVGERRFAAPTPHPPWEAPRETLEHGACCVGRDEPQRSAGREDCLTLDVYAPAAKLGAKEGAEGRAIVVYFYGGSFWTGCAAPWDASDLAANADVVVVVPNYRLHVLGFLALPEQLQEGPTNAGLLDQQLALQWVSQNAASFGGDSSRIMIIGQSAGGASVAFHLTMPSSFGLYSSAILQSPGGRKGWVQDLKMEDNDGMTTEEMVRNSEALAHTRGCGHATTPAGGGQRLACMRNLSLAQLLEEPFGRFAPGIDTHLVLGIPLHLVRRGNWSRVPVAVGSTSCESCAGQGMLVKPGPPRNLSAAEYAHALNLTFSPLRFNRPVRLTPEGVARWYRGYEEERGRWEALTRIASDDGHACNAHFFAEAFLSSPPRSRTTLPAHIGGGGGWRAGGGATAGEVRRYEFRATGGHADQKLPGAVHASELQYIFRTPVPYEPSTLNPEQDLLAQRMQRLWGRFAQRGTLEEEEWPACTAGRAACDRVAIFDTPRAAVGTEASVDDGSAALRCEHWREFM
jgi:carboxylesterase type B